MYDTFSNLRIGHCYNLFISKKLIFLEAAILNSCDSLCISEYSYETILTVSICLNVIIKFQHTQEN